MNKNCFAVNLWLNLEVFSYSGCRLCRTDVTEVDDRHAECVTEWGGGILVSALNVKSVVSKGLLVEDVGCWLGLRCGELQWLSCSERFYSYCACFRHYTQVSVSFASALHCVRAFICVLYVRCLANRASLTQYKRESTRASRSGAM